MQEYDIHTIKILGGISIRTKFIIIISLLVCIISMFILFYFPLKLEKQAIESIADKAHSIAAMAADSISPILVFTDKQEMNTIIRNVRNNKDLVYLIVLDNKGKIFSEFKLNSAVNLSYNYFSTQKPITDDGLFYWVTCPINNKEKRIGQLYLALSLADLHDRIGKSRRTIAMLSLVIFIFGVIAAFFISTAITRPLNKMIRIIEQISHGDLSQRILYTSGDELGKLASSFNLMIENLENSSGQLEQLNNNLEQEVAERTEKLQEEIDQRWLAQQGKIKLEEQLRQAQKMESIGTLAGGIAHDFNNILTAVIGYTELTLPLLEEGSRSKSNLENVLAASMRAKDLIKKILTFSRKSENRRLPICLDKVVGEALTLIRSTLPSTIEIFIDLPHMENVVLANESEIHQIVMNLCTNAAHAMRGNGGTLRVELKEVYLSSDSVAGKSLKAGTYQRLTISDTGCGMHPAIMSRIFEPYFTTKKEGDGTGMGLSMVHGIIKSCGGDITVYSEPDKGSTFNIFLPIVHTTEGTAALESTEPIRGGTERILVVDDEPAIVELEKDILVELGYQVTACESSVAAYNIFVAAPDSFDMVISDQTMPRMTGLQMVHKIRQIKAGIPILLCSGFSEVVNEDTYKSFEIDAFLMKPIIKNDFSRLVRAVLDGHKQ